jgi:archaemetzincin
MSEFYDPARRQYNGTLLLKEVNTLRPASDIKTLGLFSVDLFIPVLTYIFGQAYLNGQTGIASLYRLRNELYGLRQNNSLLQERFAKVCVHELGHAFGLVHCYSSSCVMQSSTYVEELDQKSHSFCHYCRDILDH